MRENRQVRSGIKLLLQKCKKIFRTAENQNHYSEEDYKVAERKFLRYVLEQRKLELDE